MLSPLGDFTLRDGSKRAGTVQHCTHAAFDALVANWEAAGRPDILVDIDHAAETGGRTEAAAWCSGLESTPQGLFGVFALTPKGRELVANRAYRFVSPAWTLDAENRPARLVSVGLTNKPNLPVTPVVNKAGGAECLVPGATLAGARLVPGAEEAGNAPSTKHQAPSTKTLDNETRKGERRNMDTKTLAGALGLGADADEATILNACRAATAAVSELAQVRAEQKAADAAAFAKNAVAAGQVKPEAEEAVKNAYLRDPETAKAMLDAVAARTTGPLAAPNPAQGRGGIPAAPLLNSQGKTPDLGPVPKDRAALNAEMAALPPNERAKFYRENYK